MENQPPTPHVIRTLPPDDQGRFRIFELSDGNFACIGTDNTEAFDPLLPDDAARADYERTVTLPRSALINAKEEVPEE